MKYVATIHFESDEGSVDNWEELLNDRLDGIGVTDIHVEEQHESNTIPTTSSNA